ncbi:MAG: molecular chaperone GroEL [Glaciimonas sp.]|nr:molecular chaperone GroEL [Glaciimonas sp.]
MATEVIYSDLARQRMIQGLDLLARAVRLTLGPAGPSVMIQHRAKSLAPIMSRDGVTVANAISLTDPIADLGARILRDVANSVSREAGDGTTSAIVLAHSMAKEAFKSIAAGADPMQIKKGMDLACSAVIDEIKARAVDGSAERTIVRVASLASREEEIGHLLAKVVNRLGKGCTLNLELGQGREDEFEVVEGVRYGQGFVSSYFVTDKARQVAELERPFVLFYDEEISHIDQIIPIYDMVREADRPLLIIAENLTDKALTTTVLNQIRGIIRVVAVKPPAYGDRRLQHLADLAVLTGGRVLLSAHGNTPECATIDDLGQARRVIVDAESTTIIGGAGDPLEIAQRLAGLRSEFAQVVARRPGEGSPSGNLHELNDLEERIAHLSGAMGVIKVGGVTDIEIKERLTRVENAWRSVSAALDEGVLAGGGADLLRARSALEGIDGANQDQARGVAVVRDSLAAPLRQIAVNAGLSPDTVMDKLLALDTPFGVFEASTRSYGDAFEKGVLDPVKVVRLALKNAIGVVGLMITTEAVVTSIRDTSAWDSYDPEWAAATREDPRA